MLRVIAAIATVATLLFAGCAGTQPAGSGSSPPGPGATKVDYDERKGDARPFVDAVPVNRDQLFTDVTCPADSFGTTRCRVSVSVTYDHAGKCKINAPNITFDKPNRKYIVAWLPPSDDYRFCPLLGDGVTFKEKEASVDEQFDDAWAGDNAGDFGDGASFRGKGCFKRFRMWAANTKGGAEYAYNMQFRRMSPTEVVCTVDPFIRNGR